MNIEQGISNIEHNLLARLPNGAACIGFSDQSYNSLEFLFRNAKNNSIECVELEVVAGICNLPSSDDLTKIIDDLSKQLGVQLHKLGIEQRPTSCQIQLTFDLESDAPVWVNKTDSSCTGVCKLQLDH